MSNDPFKIASIKRGVTLNSLKDEMYSLNMRMRLAMQHHNEEAQDDIKEQMAAVRAEIERMCLGGAFHRT